MHHSKLLINCKPLSFRLFTIVMSVQTEPWRYFCLWCSFLPSKHLHKTWNLLQEYNFRPSNIKLNFHTKRYAYDICILIGRKIILTSTSFIAPYVSSREYLFIMRHYLSKSRLDTQFKDVLGMRRKPKQLEKVFSGTRLRCVVRENIISLFSRPPCLCLY